MAQMLFRGIKFTLISWFVAQPSKLSLAQLSDFPKGQMWGSDTHTHMFCGVFPLACVVL